MLIFPVFDLVINTNSNTELDFSRLYINLSGSFWLAIAAPLSVKFQFNYVSCADDV